MKNFILLILCLTMFSGCAKKSIPEPNGEDVGVLAIPIKFIDESNGYFAYSYSLTGKTAIPVSIHIKKTSEDFVYSCLLPSGYYKFDQVITRGKTKMGSGVGTKQKNYALKNPISYFIEKGKITMLQDIFEVKRISDPPNGNLTSWKTYRLDKSEIADYQEKLLQTEYGKKWEIDK